MRRRMTRHLFAGFTLVELMVAITGGLFVSITVFLLARHSSRFYQRQSRLATATLASVVGFERLRADIARTAFLASPNIRRDPAVCGDPVGDDTWPAYLGRLQSVFIEPTTGLPQMIAGNGLSPRSITLAGSYSSAEQFPIRTILFNSSANSYDVYLQTATGAMARLGYDPGDPGAGADLLATAFPAGRAVRIVDQAGRHHYGSIDTVSGGTQPYVRLQANAPQLIQRSGSERGCGIKGNETGAQINVVNIVRYRIGNMLGAAGYEPLGAGRGPAYEANRTELIREELDVSGTAIAGTQELVSEYAVDLGFELLVAQNDSSNLQRIAAASLSDWAGDVTGLSPNRGPQLIRSVRAWLSVRSREADRQAALPVNSPGPILRFQVDGGGSTPFARVRSVQSLVTLNNQVGVTWQ